MSKVLLGKTPEGKWVEIDLRLLLESRLLLQANSGGGKSWGIRRLIEQLFGKVQIIVIDREGEFPSLCEKYDFLLVGQGHDVPADIRSARMLAEKLLELRASAVIDLYEAFRTSAIGRLHWVRDFLMGLVDAPKTLWHDVVVIVDEAHLFCMDLKTQILTNDGWKSRDEVDVDTQVVAYDPGTETYRLERVQRVLDRNYEGEMVRLSSDGIDCLVTPDHRVVYKTVQRSKGRYGKKYGPFVRSAETVPNHIQIPIGGDHSKVGISGLSLEMCRLLGWIITDGSSSEGRYISIEQSTATCKVGRNISAHLALLCDFMGAKSKYIRKARITTEKDGRLVRHHEAVTHYLGVELSSEAYGWLKEGLHRVPRKILSYGSKEQLEAIFEGMLEGDGTSGKVHWGWKGWTTFYPGNDEELADDFQELATRLGVSTSKRWEPSIKQWQVLISRRKEHYIRKPQREMFSGPVWDITVPSGAFIARRNGKVFVTGNCPEANPKAAKMEDREIIQGCKEAMVALATVGRKRGQCAVWATQRLAKLDKDASAELFNRMVGMTMEDTDVDRAIDLMSVSREDRPAFRKSLRELEPGNFYVFGRAIAKERTLMKFGPVLSHHPKAGSSKGVYEPPPPSEKVKTLLAKLADLPKEAEAKARTEKELRAEVAALKQKLVIAMRREGLQAGTAAPSKSVQKRLEVQAPVIKEVKVEVPVITPAEMRKIERLAQVASLAYEKGNQASGIIAQALRGIQEEIRKVAAKQHQGFRGEKVPPMRIVNAPPVKMTSVPAPERQKDSDVEVDKTLLAGERKMLGVLAQFHPGSRTKSQLGALAGYTPSGGTFGQYYGKLKRLKFIQEGMGGEVSITEAGLEWFGGEIPEGPRSPQELLEMWRGKLLQGERKMLDTLVQVYPESMTKYELGEKSGYTSSGGTFGQYLGTLRRNALISIEEDSVKASATFFDLASGTA